MVGQLHLSAEARQAGDFRWRQVEEHLVEMCIRDSRKAFAGLALLIVRSKPGPAGAIHVTATSEGLTQASADLTTRAAARTAR